MDQSCMNQSTMKSYQILLNAFSVQYQNWTINVGNTCRWILAKQCYASDSNQFSEIVSIPATITQNTFLANGQYTISMGILLVIILLLFSRATTSITKDDSLAYLFKDLMALLKLLHWKNCDYSNIAFTTSCFLIFVALLPLLLTLWLCMLCYRQYIHYVIKVSVCNGSIIVTAVAYIMTLQMKYTKFICGFILFSHPYRFIAKIWRQISWIFGWFRCGLGP